jgi:beta-N-acetylhexosaminidase
MNIPWYLLVTLRTMLVVQTTIHSASISWSEMILARMSREEKMGQLIALRVKKDFDTNDIYHTIRQYHIGAIIPLKSWTIEAHTRLTDTMHTLYPSALTSPLLIIEDAETGVGMRISEVHSFPQAMTLGAIEDLTLIYEAGKAIGRQCKALGIHVNCAPVVDINSNPNNPVIGMRSFGDTAVAVTASALAYAEGLWNAGVLPCIKHFPGHGNTDIDSHWALPVILDSYEYLCSTTWVPFTTIMDRVPCAVMVGHIAVPSLEQDGAVYPASCSTTVVTWYLREQLCFNGLIITDALDMLALMSYGDCGTVALAALRAGADILLCPSDPELVIATITAALESDLLSEKELDAHVLRVLHIKKSLGIHQLFLTYASKNRFYRYEDLIQTLYDSAATSYNHAEAFLPAATSVAQVMIGSPRDISSLTELFPVIDPTLGIDETTLLLITVYPGRGVHQLLPADSTLIQELLYKHPHSLIILFGSPYCLRDLPPKTPVVLLYEDTVYTHKTALKVITGDLTMAGKLPITISSLS